MDELGDRGAGEETGAVLVNPLAADFTLTDEELLGRGDLADLPDELAEVEPTASRHHQALNGDEEFGPDETARRMLYAGVTAYLDLGLNADRIFDARERQRRGELVGTRSLNDWQLERYFEII